MHDVPGRFPPEILVSSKFLRNIALIEENLELLCEKKKQDLEKTANKFLKNALKKEKKAGISFAETHIKVQGKGAKQTTVSRQEILEAVTYPTFFVTEHAFEKIQIEVNKLLKTQSKQKNTKRQKQSHYPRILARLGKKIKNKHHTKNCSGIFLISPKENHDLSIQNGICEGNKLLEAKTFVKFIILTMMQGKITQISSDPYRER